MHYGFVCAGLLTNQDPGSSVAPCKTSQSTSMQHESKTEYEKVVERYKGQLKFRTTLTEQPIENMKVLLSYQGSTGVHLGGWGTTGGGGCGHGALAGSTARPTILGPGCRASLNLSITCSRSPVRSTSQSTRNEWHCLPVLCNAPDLG